MITLYKFVTEASAVARRPLSRTNPVPFNAKTEVEKKAREILKSPIDTSTGETANRIIGQNELEKIQEPSKGLTDLRKRMQNAPIHKAEPHQVHLKYITKGADKGAESYDEIDKERANIQKMNVASRAVRNPNLSKADIQDIANDKYKDLHQLYDKQDKEKVNSQLKGAAQTNFSSDNAPLSQRLARSVDYAGPRGIGSNVDQAYRNAGNIFQSSRNYLRNANLPQLQFRGRNINLTDPSPHLGYTSTETLPEPTLSPDGRKVFGEKDYDAYLRGTAQTGESGSVQARKDKVPTGSPPETLPQVKIPLQSQAPTIFKDSKGGIDMMSSNDIPTIRQMIRYNPEMAKAARAGVYGDLGISDEEYDKDEKGYKLLQTAQTPGPNQAQAAKDLIAHNSKFDDVPDEYVDKVINDALGGYTSNISSAGGIGSLSTTGAPFRKNATGVYGGMNKWLENSTDLDAETKQKYKDFLAQYTDENNPDIMKLSDDKKMSLLDQFINSEEFRSLPKEDENKKIFEKLNDQAGENRRREIIRRHLQQGGVDAYTPEQMVSVLEGDVEHILPISQGGSDHPDNWLITSPFLNRGRGNIPILDWIKNADFTKTYGIEPKELLTREGAEKYHTKLQTWSAKKDMIRQLDSYVMKDYDKAKNEGDNKKMKEIKAEYNEKKKEIEKLPFFQDLNEPNPPLEPDELQAQQQKTTETREKNKKEKEEKANEILKGLQQPQQKPSSGGIRRAVGGGIRRAPKNATPQTLDKFVEKVPEKAKIALKKDLPKGVQIYQAAEKELNKDKAANISDDAAKKQIMDIHKNAPKGPAGDVIRKQYEKVWKEKFGEDLPKENPHQKKIDQANDYIKKLKANSGNLIARKALRELGISIDGSGKVVRKPEWYQ